MDAIPYKVHDLAAEMRPRDLAAEMRELLAYWPDFVRHALRASGRMEPPEMRTPGVTAFWFWVEVGDLLQAKREARQLEEHAREWERERLRRLYQRPLGGRA